MSEQEFCPRRVVLDIETVACPLETFSEQERSYLAARARQEGDTDAAAEERAANVFALSALTAQVALIGALNPDTQRARLYLLVPPDASSAGQAQWDVARAAKDEIETATERRVDVVLSEFESGLLAAFWKDLARFQQVITFNGRAFDGPFLMYRSMMCDVAATRDLVGKRYDDALIDLADRLTFFGATRDRYTMDFWCRRLGIVSPKESMTGDVFGERWRAGELEQCCRYNLNDLRATAQLFDRYIAAFGGIFHLRRNGEPVTPPAGNRTNATAKQE
ncbi:MAG: ribonuclease H-like domain-containing protein [bacterium]|nr:ribonuclease H-like domain-containing protein [bacterium]